MISSPRSQKIHTTIRKALERDHKALDNHKGLNALLKELAELNDQ